VVASKKGGTGKKFICALEKTTVPKLPTVGGNTAPEEMAEEEQGLKDQPPARQFKTPILVERKYRDIVSLGGKERRYWRKKNEEKRNHRKRWVKKSRHGTGTVFQKQKGTMDISQHPTT